MVVERSYFVTFRLKGSLPAEVVAQLKLEREALLREHPSEDEFTELDRRHFRRVETILDSSKAGPMHLGDRAVARVVMGAFEWLDEERSWEIHAAVVMPNHCHLLLRNRAGMNHLLGEHLGVLKGYTAREANRILGLKGNFWQDENFDHWCRTPEKFEAAIRYIQNNPVKAGLVRKPDEWPWLR